MNQLLRRASATATHLIRTDHAHVLETFHQYQMDASPRMKKALADSVCSALEIHSQLEEEIFYPAVRAIANTEFVSKSAPEHQQMRELVAQLRNLEPTDSTFDNIFFRLMNVVMHHVADEETLLLPAAERILADRLGQLGAQMTKRRRQLAVPRTGRRVDAAVRSMGSGRLIMGATALLACSYLLARPRGQRAGAAHRPTRLVGR